MPERTAMHSRGSFRGGRQVTRSDQLEPRQRALLEAPVHAPALVLGVRSTSRNAEPAFFSRCRSSSTRPPIGSSGCESRQAASVCDAKVQRRRQTRLRDATASVAAAGRRRAIWRGRSTYERASGCERPKGRKRVCSSARPGSGALTVVRTARVSRHASARGSEARDAAAVSALLWRLCF